MSRGALLSATVPAARVCRLACAVVRRSAREEDGARLIVAHLLRLPLPPAPSASTVVVVTSARYILANRDERHVVERREAIRRSTRVRACERAATFPRRLRLRESVEAREERERARELLVGTYGRRAFRVAQRRDRNCVSLTYIGRAACRARCGARIGVTVSFDNGAHT